MISGARLSEGKRSVIRTRDGMFAEAIISNIKNLLARPNYPQDHIKVMIIILAVPEAAHEDR
jgi:ribose/xylose/arabinose/galactoside ABC-type transport system permease subunit